MGCTSRIPCNAAMQMSYASATPVYRVVGRASSLYPPSLQRVPATRGVVLFEWSSSVALVVMARQGHGNARMALTADFSFGFVIFQTPRNNFELAIKKDSVWRGIDCI